MIVIGPGWNAQGYLGGIQRYTGKIYYGYIGNI